MTCPTDEPDPERLLPEDLRATWVVAPRASVWWMFTAGMVLGAGVALTAAGYALGEDGLEAGFPAALLVVVSGRLVAARLERRRVEALRGRV